ncbi:MAG: putative metal-binding protein [Yoonia sp.]|jgi:predicted metal-binding protein
MTKRVTICETCAGPGTALAAELGDLSGWDVVMHPCLSVCDEPVAMAVQGEGSATYVFAGLTDADADDVRAFVALYDDALCGWVADARPAGRLRFCLKSRVPAL